jgi:RNA-directed DNA polymerase
MGFLRWLFKGRGYDVDELARRLAMDQRDLRRFEPRYREFTIPKRSGGRRRILAPDDDLKGLQRRILRRLLSRLKAHPAATGFERGKSIVTNAGAHQGQAVVLRFDLKDFFPSTTLKRLKKYFRRIGWNRPATKVLLRLCTYQGGLPQGAPTSPRLSNLVNHRLDARLAGMAAWLGAVYTRYADDITISLPDEGSDRARPVQRLGRNPRTGELITKDVLMSTSDKIHFVERFVRRVVEAEGYQIHRRRKLSIRRRHQCQTVTGLVVNDRVNLPRATRRWLRAVEHRTRLARQPFLSSSQPATYGPRKRPTLTPDQLQGWQSLQAMIARQAAAD